MITHVTTVSSPAAQIGTVVRAPKTGELIATHLRRQIVRGELRPGETLPAESQLMEQYGVSRPTLREAFRILEAETLISVRRGSRGGARVVAPDASVAARYVGLLLQMQGATINDVYEARMISEPPCARLLALHRTDEDIEKLTQVVDELKAEVAAQEAVHPRPVHLVQPHLPLPRADPGGLRQQDHGHPGRRAAGHRRHPPAHQDRAARRQRHRRALPAGHPVVHEAHQPGQGRERGRRRRSTGARTWRAPPSTCSRTT